MISYTENDKNSVFNNDRAKYCLVAIDVTDNSVAEGKRNEQVSLICVT